MKAILKKPLLGAYVINPKLKHTTIQTSSIDNGCKLWLPFQAANVCHFDITHAIGCSYSLLSPASLCIAPQVASGLCITLIKEAMDKMGLGAALNCSAFKRVSFVVVNGFNCGERLEEDINQCIPLLLQLC